MTPLEAAEHAGLYAAQLGQILHNTMQDMTKHAAVSLAGYVLTDQPTATHVKFDWGDQGGDYLTITGIFVGDVEMWADAWETDHFPHNSEIESSVFDLLSGWGTDLTGYAWSPHFEPFTMTLDLAAVLQNLAAPFVDTTNPKAVEAWLSD